MNAVPAQALDRYYRLHAGIYDSTRWSFLFGRTRLLEYLTEAAPQPRRILEVGCGTGRNLLALARLFPAAQLTGIDLSAPMLARACHKLAGHEARIELLEHVYEQPLGSGRGVFDVVLFAYTLSLINPGWEQALRLAYEDLAAGGLIAVVDFDDSSAALFKRWMQLNHVRMEGHLLPALEAKFRRRLRERTCAYGGLWRYFLFIGGK